MWHFSQGIDLWPDATEAEARDWWENERRKHNDFAERFNRARENMHRFYFFKKRVPKQIALMPNYENIMKQYRKG